MSLRESLKALLGAGRELNRGRKCSSSSMPLLWRHGVGAASPSQLPPTKRRALTRAGGLQPLGDRGMEQRGRYSQVKELGEGRSGMRRERSIPTAPHLQPNFLQRGRPQATSSRAVAPSPAATPFPPSLQPRPGAPSLLPEGAAAVPARRWGGEAAELGVRSRRAGSGPGGCSRSSAAASGGAERLRTRQTALPAPAGNQYRVRRRVASAAWRPERDGRRREGWGQDGRGLCKAHLAFLDSLG